MKFLMRICFSTCVLLLGACSMDALPKYSIIQGLRIIALTLDEPEINFNGSAFTLSGGGAASVNLTPVISDLYGNGRGLSYSVYYCLDGGIGLGAIPTCADSATRVAVATDQAVATTATFLSPNYTGNLAAVNIDLSTMPAATLSVFSAAYSALSSAQKYNGYSILIFYELYPTGSPNLKVTSFKRLVFSSPSKTVKNANPSGLEVRKDGTEITGLPSVESYFNAYFPNTQFETYTQMLSDGSFTSKTESLETAWFLTGPEDIECSKKESCTTDGTLLLTRSQPNELNRYRPPSAGLPAARGRVLIAVGKDNRGGVQVRRYCVGICP